MKQSHPLHKILDQLNQDLRSFIELSLAEPSVSWNEWISSVVKDKPIETRCWERKNCGNKVCPAYMNTCGRCWLIAGTMCCGEVQGKFAQKYRSCTECEIYQDAVFADPVSEIYEHLITLIHSLRTKQEELKALAITDRLTGLYNRNYFDIIISHNMEKLKRYGGKLALVMVDVDKFKYINDTYGHLHGDGILKECAMILRKSVRTSDILVRFGGDEFLIIMPQADCEEGDSLVARVRRNIEEWNAQYSSADYKLSFSIGCATVGRDSDLREAIKQADREMYRDKQRWRI